MGNSGFIPSNPIAGGLILSATASTALDLQIIFNVHFLLPVGGKLMISYVPLDNNNANANYWEISE